MSVSDHTTSAPVAVGLFQLIRRSFVLAHHTGRYQRSSSPEFQTFYWLSMCFLWYLQNLQPSGVLFSKETVCEKCQIAREEVVVTVTATFKSHTKLRLCLQFVLVFGFFKCHVLCNPASIGGVLILLTYLRYVIRILCLLDRVGVTDVQSVHRLQGLYLQCLYMYMKYTRPGM